MTLPLHKNLVIKNKETVDMFDFGTSVARKKMSLIKKIHLEEIKSKNFLRTFKKFKCSVITSFSIICPGSVFVRLKAREIIKRTKIHKILLELGPSTANSHMEYWRSFLKSLPKSINTCTIHLGMTELEDKYMHYFLPLTYAKQVETQKIVINSLERLRKLEKCTLYCLPMNTNQVDGRLISTSLSRNKSMKHLVINPLWITNSSLENLSKLQRFQPLTSLVLCCNLETMEKHMSAIGSFISEFQFLNSITISSIVDVSKFLLKLNPYQLQELEVDIADHLDLNILRNFNGVLRHLSIYALEYSYSEEYKFNIPLIESLESFKFVLFNNYNLNCTKLGQQISLLKNLRSLHLELFMQCNKPGKFFEGLDASYPSLETFSLKLKQMEGEIVPLTNFLNCNSMALRSLKLDFMSTDFSEKVTNLLLDTLQGFCGQLQNFKLVANCRPLAMLNKKDAVSRLISGLYSAEKLYFEIGPGFFLTEKEILRIIESISGLKQAREVTFIARLNHINPETRSQIIRDIQTKIRFSGINIEIYVDWMLDKLIRENMGKHRILLMA